MALQFRETRSASKQMRFQSAMMETTTAETLLIHPMLHKFLPQLVFKHLGLDSTVPQDGLADHEHFAPVCCCCCCCWIAVETLSTHSGLTRSRSARHADRQIVWNWSRPRVTRKTRQTPFLSPFASAGQAFCFCPSLVSKKDFATAAAKE